MLIFLNSIIYLSSCLFCVKILQLWSMQNSNIFLTVKTFHCSFLRKLWNRNWGSPKYFVSSFHWYRLDVTTLKFFIKYSDQYTNVYEECNTYFKTNWENFTLCTKILKSNPRNLIYRPNFNFRIQMLLYQFNYFITRVDSCMKFYLDTLSNDVRLTVLISYEINIRMI
jgi:hypothetical protein